MAAALTFVATTIVTLATGGMEDARSKQPSTFRATARSSLITGVIGVGMLVWWVLLVAGVMSLD